MNSLKILVIIGLIIIGITNILCYMASKNTAIIISAIGAVWLIILYKNAKT